jgi:hypothetical protein
LLLLFTRNTLNSFGLGIFSKNSRLIKSFQEQLRWNKLGQSLKSKLVNWLKEQSNFCKLINPVIFNSPTKFLPLMLAKVTLALFSDG